MDTSCLWRTGLKKAQLSTQCRFLVTLDHTYKNFMTHLKKPSFSKMTMNKPLSAVASPFDDDIPSEFAIKPKLNQIDKKKKQLIEKLNEGIIILYTDNKYSTKPPRTTEDFYIIGRRLGKGAFGRVNLCIHKLSEKLVAIKSLHKKYVDSKSKIKLQNEISIRKEWKHPNVIKLYETFSVGNLLLVVIELCGGGDLLTYMRQHRKLREPIAKAAFKQVIFKII